MNAETLARRIGKGKERRTGRNSYMVPCVKHADRTPSLHVTATSEGKILLHCHAGCHNDAVIAVLRDMGLWPERQRREFSPAERKQFGRAMKEADDLIKWRDGLVRDLREMRDQSFRLYHRAIQYIQRNGLDSPLGCVAASTAERHEAKYQECDAACDDLNNASWETLKALRQ